MSKQKTPIQQALEDIKSYRPIAGTDPFPYIIAKLQSLLPVEREAIEAACNYGYYKGADREETRNSIVDYFTSKYESI